MVDRLQVSDQDLSDLLDGRLEPERAAEIRVALGQHPELAHRYCLLLEQDRLLARLGDEMLTAPVPEEFVAILRDAPPPRPGVPATGSSPVRRWPGSAAALALATAVAAGVVLGWFGRTYLGPSDAGLFRATVEQAALAHRMYEVSGQEPLENLAAGDVLPVTELPHRFGTPVRAPTLRNTEWTPIGLKTESGSGGNAMQIAYDRGGERVTLFVRRLAEADDVPTSLAKAEGYDVLYWLDGPLVYALVGKVDRETLTGLARQIYASRAVGGGWPVEAVPAITPADVPARR